MGEVTAFLSHSWSDEDEAPGAKHALVSRWAKRRQEATGNEPTLWLVALPPPLSLHLNQYRLHARMKSYALCAAQDKACIDQSNIQQSLACLPVFLAGCQTLLVVAGATYCSRLWCVMELFTFARSECLPSEPCSTGSTYAHRIAHSQSLSACACYCTQWAATKGASRSISSPTRTMTRRRHGGC